MKSILCFELKRCFGSKRLYLSLLTGIVISLLHIIFGVLPLTQWLSSWQGDFFLTPHSAYGHWIGMDSSTVWPTLLYMLLPFLCAFPFSDTVSWDFNTGYVMQIFVRRKKSTYLFAKALTIFIASAFLTATILFFDFAGTALYLPLVRPEALTNLYGISNRSLMAHLFYHKPLQYTVIYIIMDALCLYDGPNVNNPCQNRLLDCLAGYDDLAHSLAGIDSFPVNQSFLRIAPTRKHTLMGRLPFGFVDVFVSCYTETV